MPRGVYDRKKKIGTSVTTAVAEVIKKAKKKGRKPKAYALKESIPLYETLDSNKEASFWSKIGLIEQIRRNIEVLQQIQGPTASDEVMTQVKYLKQLSSSIMKDSENTSPDSSTTSNVIGFPIPTPPVIPT